MGRGGYRNGPYGPPPPVMGTPPPRQQMHNQKFTVTHQTFDFVHVSDWSLLMDYVIAFVYSFCHDHL